MRSIISILLGFITLFGCALYINFQISLTTGTIQTQLNQAESYIASEQYSKAILEINEAYESWSQTKSWYAIILNHDTLKNIEISFLKLQQYSLYKEQTFSLAELKTLLLLLKDIPESETLRVNNIL